MFSRSGLSSNSRKRKRDEEWDDNPRPNKRRKSFKIGASYWNIHSAIIQNTKQQQQHAKKKGKSKIVRVLKSTSTIVSEMNGFLDGVSRSVTQHSIANRDVQKEILNFFCFSPNDNPLIPSPNHILQSRAVLNCMLKCRKTFLDIQNRQDMSRSGEQGEITIKSFPSVSFSKIISIVDAAMINRGSRYYLECLSFALDKYRKSPFFGRNNNVRELIEESLVPDKKKRNRWKNMKLLLLKLICSFIHVENEIKKQRNKEEVFEQSQLILWELLDLSNSLLNLFNCYFEYYTLDFKKKEDVLFLKRVLNDVIHHNFLSDEMTSELLLKFLNSLSLKNTKNYSPRVFVLEYLFDTFKMKKSLKPYRNEINNLTLERIRYYYMEVDIEEEDFSAIEKYFTMILVAVSSCLAEKVDINEETKKLRNGISNQVNEIFAIQIHPNKKKVPKKIHELMKQIGDRLSSNVMKMVGMLDVDFF